MASQTRPEPMNASPHHSKVKVSLTLSQPLFVAGEHVSGKMEMECRADKGLGINIIMVELVAIEELTSRDHSATSTFMHSRRLFQGPGLPPSNAVQLFPILGDPPIPRDYHQARRGLSTFLFRFPIPPSSPSAISFGSGLASVRYEVRASVDVAWKGERRLVTDKKKIDVVESYEEDFGRVEPEGVIIGENGKIWAQGRIVGGVIVAGESACVELQVKNHSSKKNTGLSITLVRLLHLPEIPHSQKPPLQISDTLTTVAFRGPEYIVHPGGEGVASLIFDVPKVARGVKGGTRQGGDEEDRLTEPLFEVQCIVGIKITMGIGSKDITLDLPVTVVHPSAIPQMPVQEQYAPPSSYPYPSHTPDLVSVPQPPMSPFAFLDQAHGQYPYPSLPMSPPIQPYIDQGLVWLPPPSTQTPVRILSPPIHGQQYYFPPPILAPPIVLPPRSSSAGALALNSHNMAEQHPLLPLDLGSQQQPEEPEEGKGGRASRISQQLHMYSRNRSLSPQSHRFPLAVSHSSPVAIPSSTTLGNLPPNVPHSSVSSPRSQDVVHSPRPLLSPKQSFSADLMHSSLPKSLRVEELERMAEELGAQSKDLSGDIPKASQDKESYSDKTLPAPPVPTGKERLLSPPTATRTRADAVFTIPEGDALQAEKTPPTPTLTPLRQPRHALSELGRSESGLDALERRLLAEVGTRKLELEERRPDVRTILPIGIPQPNNEHEPLHDSAISSLTLADHDSADERTQKAGKSNVSGDDREVRERGREKMRVIPGWAEADRDRDEQRDEQRKKGKKKERGKDGDAHKFRKLAKGKVAAWLGGIDLDVPPPEAPRSPDMAELLDVPAKSKPDTGLLDSDAVVPLENPSNGTHEQQDGILSAPNPRSSGFVPIGTIKRDTTHRHPTLKPTATINNPDVKLADVGPSSDAQARRVLLPSPAPPQTPKTDRIVAPPSSQAIIVNGNGKLTQQGLKPLPTQSDPVLPKPSPQPSPRPPTILPPRLDPEIKYDIRSARGGRGGKVAAVAAIWASAAAQQSSKAYPKSKNVGQKTSEPPPARPLRSVARSPLSNANTSLSLDPPKLVDFTRKRSKPIVKSMSVPAVVSSSHATPTLSSTASLARVTTSPNKSKAPIQLPPTISETPSEVGSSARVVNMKPPSRELAFGQARLRDLIKKYQGQTN